MFLKLALRNLLRRPRQTLTLGFVVAIIIAILFTGNSLLDGTDAGIEESFVGSFTGRLSVRARSDTEFGVFGDQTPVIGELFKMPVLPGFPDIRAFAAGLSGVEAVTSIVCGWALLEQGVYRYPSPLFGVDSETYLDVLPGARIAEGRLPRPGEKGAVLSSRRARDIKNATNAPLPLGSDIQFAVTDGITFRIRSAPLTGIIEYPLPNDALDSIVLTDPGTLRELYNYLILDGVAPEAAGGDPAAGTVDLLSLFDDPEEDIATAESGVDREEIEKDLALAAELGRPATNEGAWNFLLIKLRGGDEKLVRSGLEAEIRLRGWEAEVLDWRRTAGSSALFVYWMRFIFNAGFLVVAFASLIILVDSLIIGVLERIPEIGTMRALGVSRGFIRRLFIVETTLLTVSAGFLGVLLGAAVCLYLRKFPFLLENPFLIQLFGGNALLPQLSPYRVLVSLGTAVLLGLVGWIYPVRLALRVQPRSAMERRT
jgi:ABC-type lipoprotein release transport system permease subunit